MSVTPFRGGNIPIEGTVGSSTGLAYVRVKSPELRAVDWDYEDLWCQDNVPFVLNVKNDGDGVARGVIVSATTLNENNVAQDTKQVALGNIAASASSTAELSLFARDTCGRDDYFTIKYTVTPQFGQPVEGTTQRFSI